MTGDTIYRLATEADLDHEDARGWYDSYGWHLTTEDAGDVTLQAVEYDWLDGTDDAAIDLLVAADGDLSRDEAESIVAMARTVREAAESVECLLAKAVECYQADNYDGVVEALNKCAGVESEHGDCPATNALRGELLTETHLYYVSTDSGSFTQPEKFDTVAEALEDFGAPKTVTDEATFEAWLERVGGYGFIEEDGEIIAEVKS